MRTAYYYPGDEYVDVVGLDKYKNPTNTLWCENALINVAKGKPFGLTEYGHCDPECDPDDNCCLSDCNGDFNDLLELFQNKFNDTNHPGITLE